MASYQFPTTAVAHNTQNDEALIAQLLTNRNLTDTTEIATFLEPQYEAGLHDPWLLHDIKMAVERIQMATRTGEQIAIYSDYDCDGIPGAVIMNDFFKMLSYENFEIYIPDRHKEGYGLQIESLIRIFEKQKPHLIITLDLGITNNQEVLFCNQEGIDVIITDHHLPGKELPPAYAIINPKQIDCHYPDEMLCGSGVAFKFIQGFIARFQNLYHITAGQEKWLLDMVGLATLSDMVPLVKENRVFAYFGMLVMKKTRRPGLIPLFKKAGLKTEFLTDEDVTFTITPRINAAGRMDHPRHAFELLATQDRFHAEEKSLLLHEYNLTRKNLVKQVMKKAQAVLEQRKHWPVIVIGDRSWTPGILGLVASRLVEKFGKPVFVWGAGEDEHVMKGSCRSDGTVHLVDLMYEVRDMFVHFGGHELAGGFAISFDHIHFLEEKLSEVYNRIRIEKKDENVYMYETELTLEQVGDELYNEIQRLAPFGVGNPKPVFLFRDLVLYDVRLFGKHNEHLELQFRTHESKIIKAIAFFTKHDDFSQPLVPGLCVQLFASLEKSYFGYRPELRLRIEDIHIS